MYHYKAYIDSVVDGDTAHVIFDLGFNIALYEKIRLKGINAPELKGDTLEAGEKAREYLRELVEGKQVEIQTYGKDKYGRWLADVFLDGENINQKMIDSGNAVPYMDDQQKGA